MKQKTVTRRKGGAANLAIGSLVVVAVLVGLLFALSRSTRPVIEKQPLLVYCAAGIKLPVELAAQQYEMEFGVPIRLQYGPSGGLESQIEVHPKGDLFIPAAIDPFLLRGRKKKLVAEIIPLARFSLVLAVRPGNPKNIHSLDDLLRDDVNYVLANKAAAVAKKTENILKRTGKWEQIHRGAKVFKPTVTEVALDVKEGSNIDAGFVWNSTAKQFGLDVVAIPELVEGASSNIAAGVLTASTNPTAALHFARYLAAPEKGGPAFTKHHYDAAEGDPWAENPQIMLYSGGVNRLAVEETIRAFNAREGCVVETVFDGCGTLVGKMKIGQQPDAYFACDVSFVEQVQDQFDPSVNVSRTDMVLLVPPGNPKNLRSLTDLGEPGLRIGMADENLSALGFLTRRLLSGAGVYDEVLKNRLTTPRADLLVAQMLESDKLDAVVVYRANCAFVGDRAEIVLIDHPAAIAVQPFAIHRKTQYPQLTARLLDAISTAESRERFEQAGFEWLADSPSQ